MKAIVSIALAAFLPLCLVVPRAHANLIQGSDSNFGANSLAIDTYTGLGWLNLNESTGLSYDQVLADMQPGGIYYGYRYATAQEVLGLYNAAGIAIGYSAVSTPAILSFLSLIGTTSHQDGYAETFGISGTLGSGGMGQYVPGVDYLGVNGVPEYNVTGGSYEDLIYGPTTGSPGIGNWLVKEVPEKGGPVVYVLAAAGLAGFMYIQRREKSSCRE